MEARHIGADGVESLQAITVTVSTATHRHQQQLYSRHSPMPASERDAAVGHNNSMARAYSGAASDTAAVSLPRPQAYKGSASSLGTGWHNVLRLGRPWCGDKGHHLPGHHLHLPVRWGQLTCLILLLLLPVGFLANVHVMNQRDSGSGVVSIKGGGSSVAGDRRSWLQVLSLQQVSSNRHQSSNSSSSLEQLMEKLIPLPPDKKDPSADGIIDSGPAAVAAWQGNYCIPPSRATTWEQIDAEQQPRQQSNSNQQSNASSNAGNGQQQQQLSTASEPDQQQQQQRQDVSAQTTISTGDQQQQQQAEGDVPRQQQQQQPQAAQQQPPQLEWAIEDEELVKKRQLLQIASAKVGPPKPALTAITGAAAAQAAATAGAPLGRAASSAGAAPASVIDYYDIDAAAATVSASVSNGTMGSMQSTATTGLAAAPLSPDGVSIPITNAEEYYDVEAAAAGPSSTAGQAGSATIAVSSAGSAVAGHTPQQQQQPLSLQKQEQAQRQQAQQQGVPAGKSKAAELPSSDQSSDANSSSGASSSSSNTSGKQSSQDGNDLNNSATASIASNIYTEANGISSISSSGSEGRLEGEGASSSSSSSRQEKGDGSDSSSTAAAAAARQTPAADPSASVAGLDIALVNDVEFHHEVTLGLMYALQKHKARLKVYLHNSMFDPAKPGNSAFDFMTYVQKLMPGNTLRNAYYKPHITKTDVAIFVSPEFSIDYYRTFIRQATPRMLIVFIHEPTMELRRLQYIINMHPLVGVVALSAHVAELVRSRMHMHQVHWMMPVLPAGCSNNCWEGFAVQGKFEGNRRSYASLWDAMMLNAPQSSSSAVPTITRRLAAANTTSSRNAQQLPNNWQQLNQLGHKYQQQARHVWQQQQRQLTSSQVPHLLTRVKQAAARTAHTAAAIRALNHRRLSEATNGNAAAAATGVASPATAANAAPVDDTAGADGSAASGAPAAAGTSFAAGAAGLVLPHINVLGSGKVSLLDVPQKLRPYVHLYRGLGYADYYDTLCRSLALLPLFNASSGYLSHKISSTVLASVATGVPMAVPPQFLQVYQAFAAEHVIITAGNATSELDTMMGLAAQPPTANTLAARRRALARLRFVLNHQATAKLEGLMVAAIGKPHATTKQD